MRAREQLIGALRAKLAHGAPVAFLIVGVVGVIAGAVITSAQVRPCARNNWSAFKAAAERSPAWSLPHMPSSLTRRVAYWGSRGFTMRDPRGAGIWGSKGRLELMAAPYQKLQAGSSTSSTRGRCLVLIPL